jgi:hypothetical protein
MQSRFLSNMGNPTMLELRPSCEGCGKTLPANAPDAMICSYECTFCEVCAMTLLRNVCPNCGGNFQLRPIRPKAMLATHPASEDRHDIHIDEASHARYFERYRSTPPGER